MSKRLMKVEITLSKSDSQEMGVMSMKEGNPVITVF